MTHYTIITGDIIGSRQLSSAAWQPALEEILSSLGREPRDWQRFRGDSFQLCLGPRYNGLREAIKIKARIKMLRHADVRMGLGIGSVNEHAARVTESNGEAFVFSGEVFDKLKIRKSSLAVKTRWPGFDRDINLMLDWALVTMDQWLINSAEVAYHCLCHPDATQQQLGEMMNIAQNTVSSRKSRAHVDLVDDLLAWYHQRLHQCLDNL